MEHNLELHITFQKQIRQFLEFIFRQTPLYTAPFCRSLIYAKMLDDYTTKSPAIQLQPIVLDQNKFHKFFTILILTQRKQNN